MIFLNYGNFNVYIKDKTRTRSRRKSSSVKSSEEEIFKNPKQSKFKNFKLSKLHYLIIGIVVILIAIITTLSIYLIPKKNPQGTTTSIFDVTTLESTNPEEITDPDQTTDFISDPSTNPTTESTSSSTETTSATFPPTIEPIADLIVPRTEWTSDPIHSNITILSNFSFPIRRIIVGQTDDVVNCTNKTQCISKIQTIRSRFQSLLDIPWNFLIGDDGHVYEGRGYRYQGDHTMNLDATDYNDIGIGIGLIGNFATQKPSTVMLSALEHFIEESLESGNFTENYKIFFQDDLTFKDIDAVELRNSLKEMDNFYERN